MLWGWNKTHWGPDHVPHRQGGNQKDDESKVGPIF